MENNQDTGLVVSNAGNAQYVNVRRIMPKNHHSIKILKFYEDIQDIMNRSLCSNLNCIPKFLKTALA